MTKRKKSSATTWNSHHIGEEIARFLATIGANLKPYRQEIGGIALLVFTFLVLLNLAGLTAGTIPVFLGNLTRSLFGWGAVPVVICAGMLGIQLVSNILKTEPKPISLELIIGVELTLLSGLVLVHIVAGDSDPLALARAYGGGGFVGWSLGALLGQIIGPWATGIIFLIIGLAGLGLIFGLNKEDKLAWSKQFAHSQGQHPSDDGLADPPDNQAKKSIKKVKKPRPAKPTMSAAQAIEAVAQNSPKLGYKLPPLDLLAPPSASSGKSANARYQAQTIEDTLNGFGVPAQVVEINYGPTVTQFGIKPGSITKRMSDGTIREQRVRVSKINSLINDLALALAAAPIRIETPVPGRPIVGIEVPNNTVSMVSMRGVMETEEFKKSGGHLKVALGKGAAGVTAVANLAALPHLLIAGATGSGKSVCINTIITGLLMTHTPDTLKLLMIDPKMVELVAYNGIPHLIAPVVTDFEQVAGALAWATREMERRYKAFASVGARNISGYNKKVKRDERLPYMVIIIDELADLMMLAADEVERYICRIAQMARATGIHMIIATQRPSTDVVTGLIKANFPARIAFAVSSQIDSRVILDTPGADKLLGKGDMLYMAPDSPKLARLQGCFVSDAEIQNVVNYWKHAGASVAETFDEETETTDPPWAGILEEANKDDMLKEAIKLVVDNERASASFLQRKLGIGYPRASRLMDQLEEEGVVGPADGPNTREVLWQNNPEPEDIEE